MHFSLFSYLVVFLSLAYILALHVHSQVYFESEAWARIRCERNCGKVDW